jgi:hypothetical protein
MALLTPTALKGPYPAVLATGGTTITKTDRAASDTFTYTGKQILIAWNNGVTGVATVTLTSVANAQNRTGDIAMASIATGAMVVFGQFDRSEGWVDSNGTITVVASGAGAADIDYIVLTLF